ncbi:MAG: YeeE/YedE family protein [Gammaproteobacteria bacterium]|nr:YeeE/YedE family protein [Gammaproteobacteria bacterium]MBQ0839586.1 YeeE/YedE family protein [Gammaproteobacteria bacterium]
MTLQKRYRLMASLASGIVFGLGMAISGMTNTQRVQGFLDLAGAWDPTLAFVMAGGMFVTFIGYKFILKNPAPLFDDTFHLPTRTDIDKPLIIGAVLFGAGWGLVGYCPGPAIAGLSYGYTTTLIFVPVMILGMLLAKPLAKVF